MGEVIVSSLTGVVTTYKAVMDTVAPIGLSVFGAFFVWKTAIHFFKCVAK